MFHNNISAVRIRKITKSRLYLVDFGGLRWDGRGAGNQAVCVMTTPGEERIIHATASLIDMKCDQAKSPRTKAD